MTEYKKSKILKGAFKKAQEEMVGFLIIVVIVVVILFIFLGFILKPSTEDAVRSYEVENFLEALSQKTSDCGSPDNLRYYSTKELMFSCYPSSPIQTGEDLCFDKRKICDVFLNETEFLINQSWDIGARGESPIKGYLLKINKEGGELGAISYGTMTKNSKGAVQEMAREGRMFKVEFYIYY